MALEFNTFAQVGLFARRDTLGDAADFLDTLLGSVAKRDKMAVLTGTYVMYNTLAYLATEQIEKAVAEIKRLNAEVEKLTSRMEEIKRDGYVAEYKENDQ